MLFFGECNDLVGNIRLCVRLDPAPAGMGGGCAVIMEVYSNVGVDTFSDRNPEMRLVPLADVRPPSVWCRVANGVRVLKPGSMVY